MGQVFRGTRQRLSDFAIPIGELELRPHRELLRGGQALAIGGRALAVLSVLAEAGGELVAKDRLMERVWPSTVVEDNALQAQVSQLRKLLGADSVRLVVVHGRGYRLVLDREGANAPELRATLAVMPFRNLSPDPANAYICAGMTDEIRHVLLRNSRLDVLGRSSTAVYAETEPDARTVRLHLSADAMLTGSVRTVGGLLRAVIEIVDCVENHVLWSQSFDSTLDELLNLQAEVALSILVALRRNLNDTGHTNDVTLRHTDVATFRLLAEASWLIGQGYASQLFLAARLCRQAVAHRPDSASALATLAAIITIGSVFGLPQSSQIEESDALAVKALSIDPNCAMAITVLGQNCVARGRRVEAAAHFAAAIALDPHEATFRLTRASLIHLDAGHIRLGLDELAKARGLAPFHPNAAAMLAVACMVDGDYDAAAKQCELAARFGLTDANLALSTTLAILALRRRDFVAAGDHALASLGGAVGAVALVRQVHSALGDPLELPAALDVLARERARGFDKIDLPMRRWLLLWTIQLGEIDVAHEFASGSLDDLESRGGFGLGYSTLWLPELREFRCHPRFADLTRRLGMNEYWAVHGPPDEGLLAGSNQTASRP